MTKKKFDANKNMVKWMDGIRDLSHQYEEKSQ